MKKILVIMLLMLLPAVSAATISEWPHFFVNEGVFSAVYVVGAEAPSLDVVSATMISSGLSNFENVTTEVGTSKLDSEVNDITKMDAVVIGSPCENKAADQLLGSPSPCDKGLNGSTGYIQLFENNNKVQLLITGLTAEDRKAAALYLSGSDLSNLDTDYHSVQTGSGSKQAEKVKPEVKNETNSPVENKTEELPEIEPLITPEEIIIEEIEPIEVKEFEEKEPKTFIGKVWNWFKSLFSF